MTPEDLRYVAIDVQNAGSIETVPDILYVVLYGLDGSIQRACVRSGNPIVCWKAARPLGKSAGAASYRYSPPLVLFHCWVEPLGYHQLSSCMYASGMLPVCSKYDLTPVNVCW